VSQDKPQPHIHGKLIQQAAQEILALIGCTRRGRSRTWIDDRGWWIIVIEFQPSSFSKGSYLNIGAMWLWRESEHLSFDNGYRVGKFADFKNEDQFCGEAHRLALLAREQVLALREEFETIEKVSSVLVSQAKATHNLWQCFHDAVAAGCVGNIDSAKDNFKKLETWETEFDWHVHLQNRARELSSLLEDRSNFRQEIKAAVGRTRELLKLGGSPAEPWGGF